MIKNKKCLGHEFVTGWAARGGGRRVRFRDKVQRQKLYALANELWENYLKKAKAKPRDSLILLQDDASKIIEFTSKISELEMSKINESIMEEYSSKVIF